MRIKKMFKMHRFLYYLSNDGTQVLEWTGNNSTWDIFRSTAIWFLRFLGQARYGGQQVKAYFKKFIKSHGKLCYVIKVHTYKGGFGSFLCKK
jgi:hypothetical protein